jgi:hypothetical protein
LSINTVGTVSNRDGIGARLHLASKSSAIRYFFLLSAGSKLSSTKKPGHFGLLADKTVHWLEINLAVWHCARTGVDSG